MKVLVTGASGFLGSHIAELLAATGKDVRLLLRPSSSRKFLRFPHEEVSGDVTNPPSLERAVEGVDAIVHAAGLIKARDEAGFAAVNDQGTANLVAAAERSPSMSRFLYISSLAARGPGDGKRGTAPITAYGRSKLAGERRLRESSLAERSVIFQMPVIYGPRDPALLPVFWSTRLRIAPLLASGRNRISIIYASDAAHAVNAAIDAPCPGPAVYTPEDGSPHSWKDLLKAIEGAVGHNVWAVPVPESAILAAAHAISTVGRLGNRDVVFTPDKVREMAQPEWICSSEDLANDCDWSPVVTISEGASLTYDWYRQNKWL